MKLITFLFVLLFTTPVYAGISLCVTEGGTVTRTELRGNPIAGCFFYDVHKDGIDQTEFDRIYSLLKNVPAKYIKVVSGVPVEKTQTEKDDIDATLTAIAEANRVSKVRTTETLLNGLDDTKYPLAQIDQRINNIQNLADAKVFLKKFVRMTFKLYENQV